jgi:hypothetical protein
MGRRNLQAERAAVEALTRRQEMSTNGHTVEQPVEPPPERPKTQPLHVIRLRNIRAAVWVNETEHGPIHNVTVQRLYKVGPEWRTSNSFGRDDLLLLAKVLDLAHSYICQEIQGGEVPF